MTDFLERHGVIAFFGLSALIMVTAVAGFAANDWLTEAGVGWLVPFALGALIGPVVAEQVRR